MHSKKAILFLNLGTPNTYRIRDIVSYLYEFLSDRRVLSLPWLLRKLLLLCIILPCKSYASQKKYKLIWMQTGSPLKVHSQSFFRTISEKLEKKEMKTFFAMRYQTPSINSVLDQIKNYCPSELYIIPLYPQYASATTGSSIEACFRAMQNWSYFPHLKIISHFYSEQFFITSWAEKLQNALQIYSLEEKKPHVIFCFHGLPISQVMRTNPCGGCFDSDTCCTREDMSASCYVAQCKKTAHSIAQKTQLHPHEWTVAFQSRFGIQKWTQPYLVDLLQNFPKNNIKEVIVVAPSFVADCIETIEELKVEGEQLFLLHGGNTYSVLDSLNTDPIWIDGMVSFIESHI